MSDLCITVRAVDHQWRCVFYAAAHSAGGSCKRHTPMHPSGSLLPLRNGTELSVTHLKENEIPQRNRWSPSTGGGGLARVPNLRVCEHLCEAWHTQGGEGRINVLAWYRPVGEAHRDARREDRAAGKGKWSPRGTGTTVLNYPCSQPCFGGSKGVRQGSEQGW